MNIKTVRRIMRRNSLALPYAKHKNRTRRKDLTKPDNINILWETDIHYVTQFMMECYISCPSRIVTARNGFPMNFQKTCTAKDSIKAVENAYMMRFPNGGIHNLILRTDNGPQYISRESMKLLGIRSEYIQKHTPEDNGDIESFHNSLKTDYI